MKGLRRLHTGDKGALTSVLPGVLPHQVRGSHSRPRPGQVGTADLLFQEAGTPCKRRQDGPHWPQRQRQMLELSTRPRPGLPGTVKRVEGGSLGLRGCCGRKLLPPHCLRPGPLWAAGSPNGPSSGSGGHGDRTLARRVVRGHAHARAPSSPMRCRR